jgi:hypothetical protein
VEKVRICSANKKKTDVVCRIQLFVYITELHRIGVLHGDFEPRNVVQKGLRTRIIDFTHSSIDHSCLGWRGCPELKRARNELGLGFLTDWLLSVASLCTLSEGIDRARALIFLFVILSLFKLFSLCGILSHQTLRGFIFSARKIG